MSQFPINRHPEFESIRNALMNQEISPDPDKCVQEVLREEIRLQSQHHITKEPKAFVAPTFASTHEDTAPLTTGGQKSPVL